MPIASFVVMPERVGVIVGGDGRGSLCFGDIEHRIAVRNEGAVFLTRWVFGDSLRVVGAMILSGRRVGILIDDDEDIEHVLVRFLAETSGRFDGESVAVYDGCEWDSVILGDYYETAV